MASANHHAAPDHITSNAAHPLPRYVPPHRNGALPDMRYTKDQLLDLFKAQHSSDGALRDGLTSLCIGGWQPEIINSQAATSWGRIDHNRDAQQGPDACWDKDGTVEPIGLLELDDEEREVGGETHALGRFSRADSSL